jgi:hypothetical protein
MPTKWRGSVVDPKRSKGLAAVVTPAPLLPALYAACGSPPAPAVDYIPDPFWQANQGKPQPPLTPYERGLRTRVYGVNDAKAHESWIRRGEKARNKKAMEVAALSLNDTKLNSEGYAYSAGAWRLEQQAYREWLSGADATGDPARLLGDFVRALAVVIEAAQVDRPRWLKSLDAVARVPSWSWPQDEVRGRATALLMILGLSFAEAYAFCHAPPSDPTHRQAKNRLRTLRNGSSTGELRVPDPALGLSQSVRQSLKTLMSDRDYREFMRLLRTSFQTFPHLVVKDARSFSAPTPAKNQ